MPADWDTGLDASSFSLALYTGQWPWVLILCVFSPSESIQGLGPALWNLGLPSHE